MPLLLLGVGDERGNVERRFPPVIDERRQLESNFADNLRPHVDSGERVLPFFENEFGPGVVHFL